MSEKTAVELGLKRIKWANRSMPVLSSLQAEWKQAKPLKDINIAACLHVTTETANLMITLATAGASVRLCASNPLSTQDNVALALTEQYGISTPSRRGEDNDTYYENINFVLNGKPNIVMDDGADLIATMHSTRDELIKDIIAGTEETTTGVVRLRAMARSGALRLPIIAVNEAMTKHMFDNRYGTGQSSFDGIFRATNEMIAGSTVVIAGYGWCGRGLATRAAGLGARVIVVEVDPVRALEAAMDGFWATDMDEAAAIGDLFITATGNLHVIDDRHFAVMKSGAIMANAGHFNVEINLQALADMATTVGTARPDVAEYEMGDGRYLYVLGEGRLVNLACAEGHPAQVMDMSFANQALVTHWLVTERPTLKPEVYTVPATIDAAVADKKLAAMGIKLQELSEEQRKYVSSWEMGT